MCGGGVRFWGQSHFPDCLVLMEGINKMTPPFKHLCSHSVFHSLWQLWARVDKKQKTRSSAVRGRAYRVSRMSRTQEVGTAHKSVHPLWDQSEKLRCRLPLSLIWEDRCAGSEKKDRFLIQIFKSSHSYQH